MQVRSVFNPCRYSDDMSISSVPAHFNNYTSRQREADIPSFNPLFRVLLTMAALLYSSGPVEARWGAKPVAERYRPQRAWLGNFAATADVTATGSIAHALEQCDQKVGRFGYCVVEIVGPLSDIPAEITRSRTKLRGTIGMTPLTSPQNGAFLYIGNQRKEIALQELEFQGHQAGSEELYAVIIEGNNLSRIAVTGNVIHDFASHQDAHGIAVYGSGGKGIRDVIIEGNRVYNMQTGSSESIAVNGNVQRWSIAENTIEQVNNIAIAAIGGERTLPSRARLPHPLDAARYGFIENNRVQNVSTLNNPAYDNLETWAAGIYVDGARQIKISGNEVVNAPWAYEVGAENCVVARHVSLQNNFASGSRFGDLLLGGYAEQGFRNNKRINCDTVDAEEGHGYLDYLTVENNAFQSAGTERDLVTLQYRIRHALVIAPGVQAENADGNGSARGDANAVRVSR